MVDHPTISVLGVGAMGGAIVSGLLKAGWQPDQLLLGEAREERAAELRETTGCRCETDPAAAVEGSDVIVLAVKPQGIHELLGQVASTITTDQIVIALIAGVALATYEAALPGVPVVRCMPNTPALIGEGVTGAAAGTHTTATHMATAMGVLAAVGGVEEVTEAQLDAVTAVSGSGPAYVFLLAEAMIDAAVAEGLDPAAASHLVIQTIKGAGAMMHETGREPAELREQVTSPNGTTAAALATFAERGFRDDVAAAIRAAAARSVELGREAAG